VSAVYHPQVIQGSDEWHAMRCGLLTASEMRHLLTPKLKIAANDKMRAHLCEIVAQRITRFVEPHYIGDDMLRGHEDEVYARELYSERFADGLTVSEVGFVTNDKLGFTVGYSPDSLVGGVGLLECKSRRQKFQVSTVIEAAVPEEHMIQCQAGLWVCDDRQWLDFVSYSGGLPMVVFRVYRDEAVQSAIVDAAHAFEEAAKVRIAQYYDNLTRIRSHPTKRRVVQDMYV
jgi:hypothetical protein